MGVVPEGYYTLTVSLKIGRMTVTGVKSGVMNAYALDIIYGTNYVVLHGS